MDKECKYFILEDEPFAYEEIRRIMGILRPNYVLQGWAVGVEEALAKLKKAARYFGSRLMMEFSVDCPQEVIVSRNRVAEVLKWMDGQGA